MIASVRCSAVAGLVGFLNAIFPVQRAPDSSFQQPVSPRRSGDQGLGRATGLLRKEPPPVGYVGACIARAALRN
jgi:hypothetical protein